MHQLTLLEVNTSSIVDTDSPSLDAQSKDTLPEVNFDQITGQTLAISLLTRAISQERIVPAYLFAGADGVGKTLTARAFAAQLLRANNLINHPDLLWIEPTYTHQGELVTQKQLVEAGVIRKLPPQVRIEQIREIIQFLHCAPAVAARKVVIVKDAERMSAAAANALLKTLEESDGSNCIILLSSDLQKLLPTISSRCCTIPFRTLASGDMNYILQNADRGGVLENPTIIAMASGSPGKATALYDLWQSIPHTILKELIEPAYSDLRALQIAKELASLEVEQQVWLLDYLQHTWWTQYSNKQLISKVETAKKAMDKLLTPRLVWEVLLLSLNN